MNASWHQSVLDIKWSVFANTIREIADDTLPSKIISPEDFKRLNEPEKLVNAKLRLNTLNRLFAFVNAALSPNNKFISPQQLHYLWNNNSNKPNSNFITLLQDINK